MSTQGNSNRYATAVVEERMLVPATDTPRNKPKRLVRIYYSDSSNDGFEKGVQTNPRIALSCRRGRRPVGSFQPEQSINRNDDSLPGLEIPAAGPA